MPALPAPISPDRRHADGGFTLVELLVTMTLAVVLLLATFAAADALMRGNEKVDRKTDAQQEARRALSTVVEQLRDARPSVLDSTTTPPTLAATPLAAQSLPTRSSLVFHARLQRDQGPTDTTGWVRVCATATTGSAQVLIGSRAQDTYADPGACSTANTANGWTYGPLLARPIRNPGQLFNYASASCVGATCAPVNAAAVPAVRTVGVALSIDAGRDDPVFTASDAVSIRNRTQ